MPGFAGLHRMMSMLLAERMPADGRVLVLGALPATLDSARQATASRLTVLAPEEEEAMLREAGFTDVALFYAGLSFRSWVAYKR